MPPLATILVVDDSQVVVEAVKEALINDGYNVHIAYDGLEALDTIRKVDLDLILLDVDMPRMNGYQLCRLLKNDENYKVIPIVMLTSKSAESDKQWGLKAGANEYLTKPFNYSKVKEILKKYS